MSVRQVAQKHPAEVTAAAVGTPLGAVFIILGAYGVQIDLAVQGAIVILVSWIAGLVTKWRTSAD